MVLAACHVHSSWSYDGRWSLDAIATEFEKRGVGVVMITEHDRGFTEARRQSHAEQCARFSRPKCLLLPGIEYSDATNTVHILVWGSVPFLGEGIPTTELLRSVKASDGVAVLAHPSRRNAWESFDPEWAGYLTGIEIWNRKTDGWAPSRRASLLLKGYSARSFVALDFHDRRQLFPLAMKMNIGGAVTEGSVLSCLKSGDYTPTAFGISIGSVVRSGATLALSTAEAGRRAAAWAYRRLTLPTRIQAAGR